jgi:hypothetical protein
MMSSSTILATLEAALIAAADPDEAVHREAMAAFMAGFEQLARQATDWEQLRPWAAAHAEQLLAAGDALADWSATTADIFYKRGEEGAELALERRSKFELVRQLFRGTEAESLVEACRDDEVDQEYREQALGLALDPPEWVPPSHTWWRWQTFGQV